MYGLRVSTRRRRRRFYNIRRINRCLNGKQLKLNETLPFKITTTADDKIRPDPNSLPAAAYVIHYIRLGRRILIPLSVGCRSRCCCCYCFRSFSKPYSRISRTAAAAQTAARYRIVHNSPLPLPPPTSDLFTYFARPYYCPSTLSRRSTSARRRRRRRQLSKWVFKYVFLRVHFHSRDSI